MARWLRFSVRTLLIAVVLLGVFLWWCRIRMDRAQKLREAVTLANSLSGHPSIRFDHDINAPATARHYESSLGYMRTIPRGPAWARLLLGDEYFVTPVNMRILGYETGALGQHIPLERRVRREEQLSDQQLAFLVDAMPTLRTIQLWGTDVTAQGFRHLRSLGRLEDLRIGDSNTLTDACLEQLRGIATLRELHIFRSPRFSFAGLQHLTSSSESLRVLHIGGPGFTDRGVSVVAQFPHLETLNLINCNVSDEAIPHILALKNLTRLELNNTRMRRGTLHMLRKSIPNCLLVYAEPGMKDALVLRPQLGLDVDTVE